MNRRHFEYITLSASKFWENQLKTPKQEEESTICSIQNPPQPSILEVSAQKCDEYLFGGQQKIQSVSESIDDDEQFIEKDRQPKDDSFSQISEKESRKESRKCKSTSIKRQGKKRFSIQQNHLIMENIRKGSNFNEIAQKIPGSTVSQIKRQYIKRLRVINNQSEDGEIPNMMIRIQRLLENQSIERVEKIRELKILISNIENHLHITKQLILKKYLIQFQQE